MKTISRYAFACLLTITLCVNTQGATLADDGKALMPIVIAGDATERIKLTAADLARCLGKMSDATFDVAQQSDGSLSIYGGEVKRDEASERNTTDGSIGIVLGTIKQWPQPDDPSIAQALTINNTFDGKEAFVIRTTPTRILLLGNTELGATHAAYRLLHELGCRWYMPAAEWEAIPKTPRIEVDLHVDDRPAFLSRRIWYGYGFFDRSEGRCAQEYNDWSRRNAMAMSLQIYCGHAWDVIIAENKFDFNQHPEYFAMHDGERKPESHKFCISNPELRKIVINYALRFFDKNPDADMVSLDPSDGGGHCECEPCLAIGNVPERVFMLANEAAKAVAEIHPGKLVGLYAYNLHSEPPSFKLEPNVYIQLTAGFIRGQYSFDELLKLWPTKVSNMGFYEYFSVYLWDWDMPPGGRGANVKYIAKTIKRYAVAGATSIDCESGNNWGLHGRGYYLANRLMWNPDADPDAILKDFHTGAFGPAADIMQRYYERLDPGNEPLMSEHLLALAFRDLQEASQKAADRPDVVARLDQLKTYMRYVQLRWQMNRAEDTAVKKQLTLDALTHVYRSRYMYMNHWEALRQSWTPKAAEAYEEPSWSFRNSKMDHPWKVDEPLTKAEIDANFEDGLNTFKPQPIEEMTYSDDLRPVNFEGYNKTATAQRYQNGMPIAMYSTYGQPMRVSVKTGTIEWYRDRADASYKWLDADGNELASGKLPLDGKDHDVTFDPSKAGLYHLVFNDSGAGWAIEANEHQILSILPKRGQGYHHAGWMQPIWFYVPKGTKQLTYFWSGNAHRVHSPDGTIVKKVDTTGSFVTVDVPKGMDGKPWYFSQIALGNIRFFNAPNVFAASPASLLVPRELIIKDRLRMRRR